MQRFQLSIEQRVSIHAPVRGATGIKRICSGDRLFQSTPPCGGRLIRTFYKYLFEIVSIHAPVRGATKGRG